MTFSGFASKLFACVNNAIDKRSITGMGKRVGPRLRVSRLPTPSGRGWWVHEPRSHSFAQPCTVQAWHQMVEIWKYYHREYTNSPWRSNPSYLHLIKATPFHFRSAKRAAEAPIARFMRKSSNEAVLIRGKERVASEWVGRKLQGRHSRPEAFVDLLRSRHI